MKVKLVLKSEEHTSFNSNYLEYLWHKYFDIVWYDTNTTYDKSNTLFVVWWRNADSEYCKQLRDQGYQVVIDNLWEVASNKTDHFWLENPNWFWYNESLWCRRLGYHQYTPNKKYSKLAFMSINKITAPRDKIVEKIGARLENFIWSYRDQKLPNDVVQTDPVYQRFFNPEWYDDTYFSVVIESTRKVKSYQLTEKTFKPCAFYHPFLIAGYSDSLSIIKSLGFETYENIFDESYDKILDFNHRIDAVIKNIDNFSMTPYTKETWNKLQHNHDHFFNQQLVESKILSEIIEPLLNYAET